MLYLVVCSINVFLSLHTVSEPFQPLITAPYNILHNAKTILKNCHLSLTPLCNLGPVYMEWRTPV